MSPPLDRALHGVRVVSLAINLPGPLAVARLADLGAAAIKLEPPTGDPLAEVAPGWYAELHERVEVRRLDLKQPDARTELGGLLDDADVLLTAQRPSALTRLGVDGLIARLPRLVHVEIVGYDGARAEEPGHDLTYQAEHGTLTPPSMPTVPAVDLLGSERATTAALAGLMAREASGSGGRYRVALEESARDAGAAVRHRLTGEGAPLGGGRPEYGIYATSDGFVALGALEPHFAARVHEHLGATAEEISVTLAGRPNDHWQAVAAQMDIPMIGIPRTAHSGKANPR